MDALVQMTRTNGTYAPINRKSAKALEVTITGDNLILNWPADHTGWHLQTQVNPLSTGLGTNWVDVPNTADVNSFTNLISPTNGTVFYRLVYP